MVQHTKQCIPSLSPLHTILIHISLIDQLMSSKQLHPVPSWRRGGKGGGLQGLAMADVQGQARQHSSHQQDYVMPGSSLFLLSISDGNMEPHTFLAGHMVACSQKQLVAAGPCCDSSYCTGLEAASSSMGAPTLWRPQPKPAAHPWCSSGQRQSTAPSLGFGTSTACPPCPSSGAPPPAPASMP